MAQHRNALPYAQALGIADPRSVIAQTPQRLAAFYDALDGAAAERRPSPAKWNPRELMCHLADCELVWAWRLRAVLGQPGLTLAPFDQDAWARNYSAYSLAEARAMFFATRAWNIALVRGLSQQQLALPYTHPERGAEQLIDIVRIMAGHDLHHLALFEAAAA